jgi:hypothetical protein
VEKAFSASIWREDDLYVAQCLEVDVGARVPPKTKSCKTCAKL